MTWMNVEKSPLPADQEIVEVQLEKGNVLLACFTKGAWFVPSAGGSITEQDKAEIKNVVKWRPFMAVMTAYQKKKSNYTGRPY